MPAGQCTHDMHELNRCRIGFGREVKVTLLFCLNCTLWPEGRPWIMITAWPLRMGTIVRPARPRR